jgi:hypothetical protein
VMAHAHKTDFVFAAKRTSPFKSAGGRHFSRLLAAEVWASAVQMLDTPSSEVVWSVLATHCIRLFPPSLTPPWVTVCHHTSSGVYMDTDAHNTTHKSQDQPLVYLIIRCFEFMWSVQIKNYVNDYVYGARVEVIMARRSGVPRDFVEGFNKFSWRQRTERMVILGAVAP